MLDIAQFLKQSAQENNSMREILSDKQLSEITQEQLKEADRMQEINEQLEQLPDLK